LIRFELLRPAPMTTIFFIILGKTNLFGFRGIKNRTTYAVLFFLAQPSPLGNQTLFLTAK
jgi:hypothetical protein